VRKRDTNFCQRQTAEFWRAATNLALTVVVHQRGHIRFRQSITESFETLIFDSALADIIGRNGAALESAGVSS
jgi:hypothetical protein